MAGMESSDFTKLFCANTQRLRERKEVTQERMATALGISLSAYKTYETRTPLPHKHILAFVMLCDSTLDELFHIQGIKPDMAAKARIKIASANR